MLGPYQCGHRGVGGWIKLKTDAVAAGGQRKVSKPFVSIPLLMPHAVPFAPVSSSILAVYMLVSELSTASYSKLIRGSQNHTHA